MQPPPEYTKQIATFRRYKKPNEKPIILGDGKEPPSELINPDYKQQPSNSRKCVECSKIHDTIVEDTITGERLEELDKCKDCMFRNCFVKWKDSARYVTFD